MSQINLFLVRALVALACTAASAPVVHAQGSSAGADSEKRDPGDAGRGSAATAPSSGGSLATGGRSNAFGDRKTNGAGPSGPGAHAFKPDGEDRQRVSNADARLMRELAQSHLAEIKAAGLATAISDDQAVRAYGEKMLEEHYQALEQLKRLAKDAGVVLPGGLQPDQAALMKKLGLMTGKEFNQAYLQQSGVALHEAAMKLVESGARAQTPELRTYLDALRPLVEEHHHLAQAVLDKPEQGAAAVQATIRAGQSNTTAAFAPPNSNTRASGGDKGNASIAGRPAGVVK